MAIILPGGEGGGEAMVVAWVMATAIDRQEEEGDTPLKAATTILPAVMGHQAMLTLVVLHKLVVVMLIIIIPLSLRQLLWHMDLSCPTSSLKLMFPLLPHSRCITCNRHHHLPLEQHHLLHHPLHNR